MFLFLFVNISVSTLLRIFFVLLSKSIFKASKRTDLSNHLMRLSYLVRVRIHHDTPQTWYFSHFRPFVRYIGDTGSRQSWCVHQVTPNRTVHCAESGYYLAFSPRSISEELRTRDGAGAKKGQQCEGTREKKNSPRHTPSQTFTTGISS